MRTSATASRLSSAARSQENRQREDSKQGLETAVVMARKIGGDQEIHKPSRPDFDRNQKMGATVSVLRNGAEYRSVWHCHGVPRQWHSIAENTPMTAADLAAIARQHAASLQAGGVEWIPSQMPLDVPANEEVNEPVMPQPATPKPAASKATITSKSDTPPILGPVLNTDDKRLQLQMMDQKEVQGCTRCTELVRNRTRTVFGVGNIDTDLVFVGEAPGADEDKAGIPFIGAAGQLLTKIILACKLTREEIYICNVLKCRPPGNRQPLTDEISNCRGYLERQLSIIRPKFICCLGLVAAQTVLNSTISIGKLRKQIHDYQGMKVVATYHPAYLLRNPNAKKDVWDDMKMLMEAMGRPVA